MWHPDMPEEYKNQIVTGDCREIMNLIPDQSIDAIITDPPFSLPAMHYESRVEWNRNWGDVSILIHWWDMITEQFKRIIKKRGYVLVFCKGESHAAFLPSMFNKWHRTQTLVWNKKKFGLGRLWRHQHELILVAMNKAAWLPNDGKSRTDILDHEATLSSNRIHPVQKPITLLRDLIEACTPLGGIVCDPFAGSGTTCVASKQLKRNFIGIEIDQKYASKAQEMISDKLPLFVMEPEQLELK